VAFQKKKRSNTHAAARPVSALALCGFDCKNT
jgi:hypothetical protein